MPSAMLKTLYKLNDREKHNQLLSVIKSGLSNFKNVIENISEKGKETKKPYKIVDTVEEILDFNREQHGSDLKILTPSKMLSRLPIFLAQLETGNNSEKLKDKITKILYSLYRSKKLTATIYKSLIGII